MKKFIAAGVVAALMSGVAPATAATQIDFWHAFTGRLGELLDEQVAKFNDSQSEYTVVATNKGNYSETLNAGIAAFRAGEQPDILQVFEVGTATMMGAKGAIKPVYEVMAECRPAVRPVGLYRLLPATTPPPTARCCRCPTTPPPRFSGSTAMP
jgi:sn-glycerol 3-phosphate transport system substrate-binding protein